MICRLIDFVSWSIWACRIGYKAALSRNIYKGRNIGNVICPHWCSYFIYCYFFAHCIHVYTILVHITYIYCVLEIQSTRSLHHSIRSGFIFRFPTVEKIHNSLLYSFPRGVPPSSIHHPFYHYINYYNIILIFIYLLW